jgi:hypothetical protein
MSMPMSFELSTRTVLWFPSWSTEGPLSYALALALVASLGLAHEALAARRLRDAGIGGDRAAASSSSDDGRGGGDGAEADGGAAGGSRHQHQQPVASSPAAAAAAARRRRDRALAYALSLVTSYLLMLAVMTYNVGIFAAVVSGMAAGHYLFSPAAGGGGLAAAGGSRARLLGDPCCAF